MKKNLFMVAAVALVAAVSCNKMENINGVENQEPSYYVEFIADAANEDEVSVPSSVQTKTTYNESSKKTLWESSDLISVNGKKFKVSELSSDKLSAKFTKAEELGTFASPYVAVSPYQAGHVVNGTTVSGVELKAKQTAKAASFESNAVIAMAYTASGNQLSFKNACSIVKFKVGTADVKTVTISSNNGENLAGTVTLDYNNAQPKVTNVTNGSSTITLSGTFNTTSTYYVAVLASGLENGITICLDGTIAKTVANELAFKRNVVMNAGTLSITSTVNSTWKVVGDHNGWPGEDKTKGDKMYEERGLLVAKNIQISGGFKFVKNNSWNGAVGAGSSNLNKWNAAGGNNITPSQGTYDLYLEKNGKAYYIAPAGSPAPSAWSVVGIPDFDTDIVMFPVGNYLVAKNVTVSTDNKTFKFRTYSSWDTSKGSGGNVNKNKVTCVYDNGGDSKLAKGTYDIYLKGDDASVCFIVDAGSSLNDNTIVYDLDGKHFIGQINNGNWENNQNIFVCGDYLGMRNVNIGGFKIRKNTSWDNSDVWGKGTETGSTTKKEGKFSQPGGNIGEGLTGNYDVLIDWGFTNYILLKK